MGLMPTEYCMSVLNHLMIDIIRLYRIHEMQSILTDVCGVSLSVCHATHLGFTVQKWLKHWGEHSWGPMEHCES